MIQGYALDPELIVDLARVEQRLIAKFLLAGLRPERGRLPIRYPESWEQLARDHFLHLPPQSELAESRLSELLASMRELSACRAPCEWNPAQAWFRNAQRENEVAPFPVIMTLSNPECRTDVVGLDTFDPEHSASWNVATSRPVRRTAARMAEAVKPIFEYAKEIRFVDPYFDPKERRFVKALQAFLLAARDACTGHTQPIVEYHFSAQRTSAFGGSYFKAQCEEQMPRIVPRGWAVRFVRWTARSGGEKLHNRFVLTDSVGVEFGTGLDESGSAHTDSVHLLSEAMRSKLWRDYRRAGSTFIKEMEVEVHGVSV